MIFSIFFELLMSFFPAPNINIFLPFNKLVGSNLPLGLLEMKYAELIN